MTLFAFRGAKSPAWTFCDPIIVEAWRKRRYQKAFILKLNDSESEASETQVWLQFARACGYIDAELEARLDDRYSHISSQLFLMMKDADNWTL
jgi:four helix bundle protein